MAMAAILSSPAVSASELRAGAQSTAAPSSASAIFAPCVGLRVLRASQRNASPLPQSASSRQHARRMPVSTRATSAAAAAAVAAAPVAVLPVLTFEGTPAGEAELSLKTARAETAKGLVHRALITYMQNRRRGTASTLTRAEVRGGGRKPMKQKGTGNARLGSRRTPLKPGGGVVFGPKPCDWTIKINKKERRLAVGTALQSAAENMTVIEDFDEADFPAPKTKDFVAALRRWGVDYKEDNTLLFAADLPDSVALSCRNIEKLKVATPAGLNIYDVLRADKVIVTVSGLDYLNRRFGGLGFEDSDEEGGDGVVVEEINLPTAAQIAELTGEAVEEAEESEEAEEAEEESGGEE